MPLFSFKSFKRGPKRHWERVYEKTSPCEVGWYQDYPEMSMKLNAATGVDTKGPTRISLLPFHQEIVKNLSTP